MIEQVAIKVLGSTSRKTENEIDTSSFVQRPSLRTSYIENISEEAYENKNQLRVKSLPDSFNFREAILIFFVHKNFHDPSLKKTLHMLI